MAYVLTEQYPELKEQMETAIDNAVKVLKKYLPKYASGDLYEATHDGTEYVAVPNADVRCYFWEEGFYPGQLWLAYELTGDPAFREVAEKNVDDFYKRVDENNQIDWHHDIGFLYSPSCVSAYMLTGNETARKAAEMAAYSLGRRFRHRGNFIQSMSFELDEPNYKFIVDTMLNLPLLFWAAEHTGNQTYRDKAVAHLKTTLKYAMREDGTTYHHFLMDEKTGNPVRGLTWQGASDDSCWSRGQAWVVLGLALAYGYTKDESILEPFCKVTDYFVNHLPADAVPYWDFCFSDGSDEPRDASAAAITVCGILEMAKHLPKDKCNMERYLNEAVRMLKGMMEICGNTVDTGIEGLLLHSTGGRPQNQEVDACLSYGDYYYLECLMRATRDWNPYW